MAGAIDLFAGSGSISGTDLFQIDKNPLNQLSTGIEDVVGKQAQSAGSQFWGFIQSVVQAILGLDPTQFESELGQLWTGSYSYLSQFFGDIEAFFNIGGGVLGTNGFDLTTVITDFITGNLKPTNLIAMLVTDATQSGGVTGFIPLENLALDLIGSAVGGAQGVIDAILSSVGVPAGSGTQEMVDTFFTNLTGMLANPALITSTFSPSSAVQTFITDLVNPLNLLAPLSGGVVPTINIPGLDASKITSGQFPQDMVVNLTSDLSSLESAIASGDPQQVIDAIVHAMGGPATGNTATDVYTYLQQIPGVNVATTLLASVIPGLDATKIISGLLSLTTIPGLPASQITSGTLLSSLIPGLDATKIVSGQFPQSMLNITSIAGSIITGVLGAGQIPGLDATKIISGIFTTGQIPSLPASQITSGTFLSSLIPGLDATKIVSGILSPTAIPNITKAMSTDLQGVIDNIFQSTQGGSSTGNTVASVKTSLLNIPGVNIVSTLLANVIPGLDATKITTGVFPQSMVNITSIAAGIVTGVLGAGQIPGLDATKIISGIFPVGLIPGLDASQIVSGSFPQWLMPLVPVGSVGQTTPNLLANPTYATAASVAGATQWIWDGTVTHTADGTGSVKVVPNGTQLQLLSDPATPAAQGQTLACSVWLQWSAVAGTGACIQLTLVSYLAGNLVSSTVLQTISSPAANSAWTQLSGTYTVPAGVDSVRLEYTILAACTAGTIWFDDASLTKTQLLAEGWTAGLPGDLSNLNTAVVARALQTDVISLVNNLGLGTFSTVGGSLSAITSRLNYLNAGGLFNSAQLTNIANIPLLPPSQIPGLDATKIISGVIALGQIPTGQLGMNNIADLQHLNDYMTNTLVGVAGQFSGTTLPQSNASMASLYDNMLNNTQSIQAMRASNVAANVSGVAVSIDFANYANGPLPNFFTVTYTGSGSSQIGISGGVSGWFPLNNDGNRTAFIIYNSAPTNTDFQLVSGSMSAAPSGATSGGTPHFYAMARVDNPSNPRNALWGRAYCTGFLSYKADLGCTVNGVDTVFVTGIGLTWSTSMSVVFGANGNPRRYQVFSGTQLVYDYTEVGTTSQIGSGFRYWGAKTECTFDSNGNTGSGGTVAGTSVSDNAPPVVLGSTFRCSRHSTGSVAIASGNHTLPGGTWDTTDYCSPDMTWDGTNLVINTEGSYSVRANYQPTGLSANNKWGSVLYQNGNLVRQLGGMCTDSWYGNAPLCVEGQAQVYCHAGDVLNPGTNFQASASILGDATGTMTFFEVTLLNRSMA
jgi:hypothetical protein